jgi:hypothetical protein
MRVLPTVTYGSPSNIDDLLYLRPGSGARAASAQSRGDQKTVCLKSHSSCTSVIAPRLAEDTSRMYFASTPVL